MTDTEPATADTEPVTIAKEPVTTVLQSVSIKLSSFWSSDLKLWFAQVEAQFATRNLTRQLTICHYVVGSLTPEVAAEVRDILIRPPEDEPYDTLKEVLTRCTTIIYLNQNG